MNEALFLHGKFSKAREVGRPDFEVLLTLTCLRQVNTPTAKAAMAIPLEADCAGDSIAILSGHDVDEHQACASFHDLSAMAWTHDVQPANRKDPINRGVSGNFQSPSLIAVFGQDTNTGLQDI